MNKQLNSCSFNHLGKLLFRAASALTLGCCGCYTKSSSIALKTPLDKNGDQTGLLLMRVMKPNGLIMMPEEAQ